jgi:hypothetical protein
MKKLPVLTACILFCMAFLWSVIPMGCATIVPPSGGPRDSIPPVLITASPADSTVNFRGDRITLTFDEYVDLKDIMNNLFFTPTFEINPKITVRGKSIIIPFEDDVLEPNTTYVLDFKNAIVDVNESNPLRDFTYTFSTGPVLDSLEISGRVILAETGGIDSTLMVSLYRDFTDSAVYYKRAPYIAKLNNEGYFKFRYLPSDSFAIYAIGGSGKNRQYTDEKTLFAFAGRAVAPGQTDSLVLYAYNTPAVTSRTQTATRIPATDSNLRYTVNTQGQQDLLKDLTISFPIPLQSLDSSQIELAMDSLFIPAGFTISLDTSRQLATINTDWKDSTIYHLVLNPGFAVDTAGRKLASTDTSSFMTKSQTDYGSLSLRLRNLDLSLNPVLQFVQNNAVVRSVKLTDAVFTRDLFQPGEYNLRILFDENGDGIFTPGKFFGEKRQPEIVQPIERTITIKPSWKNEFEIIL